VPLSNPIISRVAPVKVGGNPSAGVGLLASAFDHVHPLVETSGPTNLSWGGVLNNELVKRGSGLLIGRSIVTDQNTSSASSSVVTPADVSSRLNFALKAAEEYAVLWPMQYSTAAVGTGLMLGVNFDGTIDDLRYGVLIATGATAMFSACASSPDTLLGSATTGPGGTARMALVTAYIRAGTAGTLALRFASGVAGSAVSIPTHCFGICIQR